MIPCMSAPLMQQEMFVPEPQRKIIVRPGMEAHWGVDPSTVRIAIASGSMVATHSFPRTEGFARLSDIYHGTVGFVETLQMSGWPAPGFILVEQPSGQSPNLELVYAVGVIIAALQHGIEDWIGSVRLETLPPMSWKKMATGKGNLSKMDPETKKPWKDRERYGVMRWARENGYTGTSWDEADALGIAEAARRLVTLESR
jgi:hypothetical protein